MSEIETHEEVEDNLSRGEIELRRIRSRCEAALPGVVWSGRGDHWGFVLAGQILGSPFRITIKAVLVNGSWSNGAMTFTDDVLDVFAGYEDCAHVELQCGSATICSMKHQQSSSLVRDEITFMRTKALQDRLLEDGITSLRLMLGEVCSSLHKALTP